VIDSRSARFLEAPDYAEAIEGWRVWRVVCSDDRYSLGSVVKPTLWPPGEPLQADCLRTPPLLGWLLRRPPHPAPETHCECGIYAAELDYVGQYLADVPAQPAVARVLGQVSLWGDVVECERGFRASRAYPLRIYVPVDAAVEDDRYPEELAECLSAYRVPIELLPARCADAAWVLGRRQLV